MTFKQFLRTTFKAIPALLTPVILLIGIYSGIVTPTEAAAVAAAYTLLIAFFVYRTLNIRALGKIVKSTLRTTGTIFLVVAGAYALSFIVTSENISSALVGWMSGIISSPMMFLLIVNIVFLVLGCLVDVNVSMLVVVPIVLPLVSYYGIDIVHFGVMICLNMMIGLMTPPFGMLLFITAGIGNISLKAIIKESAPMIAVLLVALAIITYVPQTVLFLTDFVK